MEMVPDVLVDHWRETYCKYIEAADVQGTVLSERVTMARLSADVADAWRQMAVTGDLEWWQVAAVTAAAEAFERQARDWGSTRRETSHRLAERRTQRRAELDGTWVRPSARGWSAGVEAEQ